MEITGSTGNCIIWHFNNLYPSPNIIWAIKSRMSWVGNVVYMKKRTDTYWISVWEPKRDHLEDLCIDGRITFR
jgi:hypothetical protein